MTPEHNRAGTTPIDPRLRNHDRRHEKIPRVEVPSVDTVDPRRRGTANEYQIPARVRKSAAPPNDPSEPTTRDSPGVIQHRLEIFSELTNKSDFRH
jgi:hypothetical protein